MDDTMMPEQAEIFTEAHSRMSDSAQEVISHRMSFIAKWGLMLVLFILVCLVGVTWFIRYPDIITVEATLLDANAPKSIVPNQEGRLVKVFVENDSIVSNGDVLAWVESIGSHRNILKVNEIIDTVSRLLSDDRQEDIPGVFVMQSLVELGELQPSYQQMIRSFQHFKDYLIGGYHQNRIKWIQRDYENLVEMNKSLKRQLVLATRDVGLSDQEFNTNLKLFGERVISAQELRNSESKFVSKWQSLPQLETLLLTNANLQLARRKELDEIRHEISLQKIIFEQELRTFKSKIEEWRKRYMILAPDSGKVYFNVPFQENLYVQSGRTIGYVQTVSGKSHMQVNLGQTSFGKVEIGQKVVLRIDAYPYQEYGVLEGKISYISRVPHDSTYLAKVELNNGLVTNSGLKISYSSGLKAQALIVTRDERLMMRFFNNILKGMQR